MLYWDLIEEFLPDFEERDDVKFDTVLFCFVHGGKVPEDPLRIFRLHVFISEEALQHRVAAHAQEGVHLPGGHDGPALPERAVHRIIAGITQHLRDLSH